jgi:hypothetical protein
MGASMGDAAGLAVKPVPVVGTINGHDQPKSNGTDYEECLACQ